MIQFLPSQKLELVVLQPTSYCNLNCNYCYLPNRKIPNRMSYDVLENAISKVLGSPLTDKRLIFLWHAGEPLAAGLKFYTQALSLIERHKPESIKVENSVQTNGTLLNDRWCDFFKQNEFHIGISLDGPQFLHDQKRRTWKNKGSFDDIMSGVNKIRSRKLDFGILAVLTLDSLQFADEIYDFFKSLEPESVGFNVEEIESFNISSSFSRANDFISIRQRYYKFFGRLIERMQKDTKPLKIREIEQLTKAALRIRKNPDYIYEPLETNPFRILTILYNGDVSPYSPEFAGIHSPQYNNFNIGNITTHTLDELAANLNSSLLIEHIQGSRQICERECQYFQMCGGTYFSNKWSENGSLLTSETLACRLHSQSVIDAFLDKL